MLQQVRFRDRKEAGRALATRLLRYADGDNVLVLALPRGGVPVAAEVAKALRADLDVFLVRKLGVPGHEELAMGAIASGGVIETNRDVVDLLKVSPEEISRVAEAEGRELARREREYRGERAPAPIRGRTVILVDDGLATGSTMRAAIAAVRQREPRRIVVAAPVASSDTCSELQAVADDVVCAMTPEPFYAVGLWYGDFSQTTDQEVREALAGALGGGEGVPHAHPEE